MVLPYRIIKSYPTHLDGSLEAWDVVKHTDVLVPRCEHVLPTILKEQARDGLRVHVVYLALALACNQVETTVAIGRKFSRIT
jgi:hypothetical protein